MKKISITFLPLLALVALASCNDNNKEDYEVITKDNINYVLFHGDNKVALVASYKEGLKEELSIPSEVNGYKVNAIASNAFAFSNLKKVIIPETITYIGTRAFAESTNLKEVVLPSNLSLLLTNTFAECSSLTTINLPSSLTYIDTGTFLGCHSLSSITFNENLLGLGSYAFASCTSLNNVDLTTSKIARLGSYCFYNCESLSNIKLNNELAYISDEAFSSCVALDKIVIPSSIKYLGKDLFNGNSIDFKILFEGNELPLLHSYTFSSGYPFALGADSNTKLDDVFKIDNNIQYSINNYKTANPTAFVHYADENIASIKLNNDISFGDSKTANITEIMPNAFSLNDKLTTVDLGDLKNLSYIGSNAFYYDYNLTSITLPNVGSDVIFGIGTFNRCRKLETINNLDKMEDLYLYGYTFAECYSLGQKVDSPFLFTSNIKSITTTDFKEWGTSHNQYIKIPKDAYTIEEGSGEITLTCKGEDEESIILTKVNEKEYINNDYFADATILLEAK